MIGWGRAFQDGHRILLPDQRIDNSIDRPEPPIIHHSDVVSSPDGGESVRSDDAQPTIITPTSRPASRGDLEDRYEHLMVDISVVPMAWISTCVRGAS